MKLRDLRILAIACLVAAPLGTLADDLSAGFEKPADAYKPQTWWHWMNGHVTKESITRDLEEMKRSGLGGFTLFNTHEGLPKGPVEYGSEAWWELLGHTMDEAERLGLKMGLFNGAGWSATGAAFVTPEMAMQEVAWTEAQVSGPGEVKVTLEVPKAALGLERDMKKDPVVNRRYYVERQKVEGHFKDLAVFAVPALPEGSKPWKLKDAWNKAGFGKMSKPFHPDGREAPADQIVPLEGIIDLSDRMNEEGELVWEAPAGRWTILRMGYQPTARQNHPAAWGGSGLEIDKMSAKAMDFYWENFLDRVVETAGERVGGTLDRVTIDSFEAGHQNWTQGFEQVFEQTHGYDLKPLLPVLSGRIISSADFSERVLWDYRRVIADLIAENYYGRMAERASAVGLEFAHEPYGSFGNTNDFEVAGIGDIPMCEWWAYDGTVGRTAEAKMAASAAHTYGRKIVEAEAFTGRPERIFETYPGGIKSQGDFFMAQGVNRFSFHTWVHDPYEVKPGFGLGTYGSRFDPRNTWWPYVTAWFDYLARCQFLLQQGVFVGDVLYFIGEEAPLRSEHFLRAKVLTDLPKGYDYAFANREILGQLAIKGKQLKTENGAAFRVLVLPESPWMSMEVLGEVEALLQAGAVVCGPKPVSPTGRVSDEERKAFAVRADRIWGAFDGERVTRNDFGKGVVYWGRSLDAVMKEQGIEPDFSFIYKTEEPAEETLYPDGDIEFIHRRVKEDDIYFLSNQHDEAKSVMASFRVTGKSAEIWFPDRGRIIAVPEARSMDDHTEIDLHFGPGEAYFVIFRQQSSAEVAGELPWSGELSVAADLSKDWRVEFPGEKVMDLPELVSWSALEPDNLKHHSGTVVYRKTFESNVDGRTSKVFMDLGEVEVIARVKVNGRDCGIAWKKPYRVEVSEAIKLGENTLEVEVANLWVNRLIGDQRYPDDVEWTDDTGSTASGQGLAFVPDWVKTGAARPESRRKAFYAWKWPHLTADKALLPSGLLGPMRLLEKSEENP